MKTSSLFVLCSALYAVAFAQTEPAISTDENGSILFQTSGDLVFEAGGEVQFMTANGPVSMAGEKGDSGDRGATGMKGDIGPRGPKGSIGSIGPMGDTGAIGQKGGKGEIGQMGPPSSSGTMSSDGLVSWNQCSWANLNAGQNYGQIAECSFNKQRDDTWLRLTWNGNMRVTNCEFCCMRWYFTINGDECSEPGQIDSVIFLEHDIQLLRQTHLEGVCRGAGGHNLTRGTFHIHFSVMDCPGFGNLVYDAYTGWNSISRIIIEEIIPRDNTFPELLSLEPPSEFIYFPHYCQYFFTNLGGREERNVGTVLQVRFKKEHLFTALRLTWEGTLRQKSCSVCCAQWWFSIDGAHCSNFEDITTSIFSRDAIDIFAPTTLTGVCNEVGGVLIIEGYHVIKLEVGMCAGSLITDTASGAFSTSRVIIEELPLASTPDVRNDIYHPNWEHCAIPGDIPEGTRDSGPLYTLSCGRNFNKTQPDTAIQVTFNGNIRLTACSNCCMRWFVTINNEECTQPAPIDGVIYTYNGSDINIHRGSTITGICVGIGGGGIPVGRVNVTMNLGPCGGFNETFDSYTALETLSIIEIKELPMPITDVPDKTSTGFIPNWNQCTLSNISSTAVNTTIMTCTLTKLQSDTVLKVSWDGNMAVEKCSNCCMRWYITIDDEECGDPGPIDAAIRADLEESNTPQFDLRRPATVSGICRGGSKTNTFAPGSHTFGIIVSICPDLPQASDVLTGYNSISRFIIEELPDQNDDECIITLPEPV